MPPPTARVISPKNVSLSIVKTALANAPPVPATLTPRSSHSVSCVIMRLFQFFLSLPEPVNLGSKDLTTASSVASPGHNTVARIVVEVTSICSSLLSFSSIVRPPVCVSNVASMKDPSGLQVPLVLTTNSGEFAVCAVPAIAPTFDAANWASPNQANRSSVTLPLNSSSPVPTLTSNRGSLTPNVGSIPPVGTNAPSVS